MSPVGREADIAKHTLYTPYLNCSQNHPFTRGLSFPFTSIVWWSEFIHRGNTTWANTGTSGIWRLPSNLFNDIATSALRTNNDHVKPRLSRSHTDLRRLVTLSCQSRWGFTKARATGHQVLFLLPGRGKLCPLRITQADFKPLWFKDIHCMFWHFSCGASKALTSAHTAGVAPCWGRTPFPVHFCHILAQQQANGAWTLVSRWVYIIFFPRVCVMPQSTVLQILPLWIPQNECKSFFANWKPAVLTAPWISPPPDNVSRATSFKWGSCGSEVAHWQGKGMEE